MTEHDGPTNEDPTTNAGPTSERPNDDDAAWFRAHVEPVVGGDVPDAWDEIQARATGRHPILIPLPTTAARAWPGRRLVAVAALLLVTVGVVGLGLKLVGSDDDQIPARSGDDGETTGFYIPSTLPDGWKMTDLSIISSPGELAALGCPCDITEISQDDTDGGYTAVASTDSPSEYFGIDASRLRSGNRTGAYVEDAGLRTVVWLTATGSRSLTSPSLNRTELEALAEAWTSEEPPVLDGHHLVTTWTRDQPIERFHSTRWTFTNAETSQSLTVTMDPGVWSIGLLVPPTGTLPGNGLPFAGRPDGIGDTRVMASWPGNADLLATSVGQMTESGDQATPADRATIRAVLGSFQPVDAATWADYLTSAPTGGFDPDPAGESHDPTPLRTDRIGDWLVGPESGTPLPQPTVQVVQSDPDDPSAAITVESDVNQIDVTAGDPFTIELTMTNRTGATVNVSGCAFGSVTWSLIDEHGLVTPAGGVDVDCDSRPQPWPNGEQRTKAFDFPASDDGGPVAAVIQYGDATARGVTVVISGQVDG